MLYFCANLYFKLNQVANELIPTLSEPDQSHYKTANIGLATITAVILLFSAWVYIPSSSKISLPLYCNDFLCFMS